MNLVQENEEFWIQKCISEKSYVFLEIGQKLTNGGGGVNVWLGEG
jgi:hypothetical protein